MTTRRERDAAKKLNEEHSRILNDLLKEEENKVCVDCGTKGPRWASWNIGGFMCIRCAGIHRNLGVHISKVKSVNLDQWNPDQVENMQNWGNYRVNQYYENELPPNFRRPTSDLEVEQFIRAKYEGKKFLDRKKDFHAQTSTSSKYEADLISSSSHSSRRGGEPNSAFSAKTGKYEDPSQRHYRQYEEQHHLHHNHRRPQTHAEISTHLKKTPSENLVDIFTNSPPKIAATGQSEGHADPNDFFAPRAAQQHIDEDLFSPRFAGKQKQMLEEKNQPASLHDLDSLESSFFQGEQISHQTTKNDILRLYGNQSANPTPPFLLNFSYPINSALETPNFQPEKSATSQPSFDAFAGFHPSNSTSSSLTTGQYHSSLPSTNNASHFMGPAANSPNPQFPPTHGSHHFPSSNQSQTGNNLDDLWL